MKKYPNVSSFKDRTGTDRWRFRKTGQKTVMLPGQPGEPEFEAAYQAILSGKKPKPTAQIIKHPGMIVPKSLRAAWVVVMTKTHEWKKLEPTSRDRQRAIAERFLAAPVDPKRSTT